MTLPSSQAPLVAGPPPSPDSPLFNGAQIKGGAAPAEPTKIRPLCLLLPGVSKGVGVGGEGGGGIVMRLVTWRQKVFATFFKKYI